MSAERATLYRCTACSKWSHAQRKPKFHQRFHPMYTQWGLADDEPPAELIISKDDGWTDFISGEGDDGGWWVRCGPFETWEAVMVDG